MLQIPNALVDNFAGFAILRFLSGFVGSPVLATGGASSIAVHLILNAEAAVSQADVQVRP